MSTYTQILYQVVFTTKNIEGVLVKDNREKLYRYIWGIIKNHKSVLYQINGTEDHIHIATHVHPSVSLSNFVKDIKQASSIWIKEENIFPEFTSWQRGYGAFTYSIDAKNNLMNYIKKQEEHHRKLDFRTEYKSILKEFDVEFDERYLL